MTKSEIILNLAQQVADGLPDMFQKKGPGKGNHFTNKYMSRLNNAVTAILGQSYVEQKIWGARGTSLTSK